MKKAGQDSKTAKEYYQEIFGGKEFKKPKVYNFNYFFMLPETPTSNSENLIVKTRIAPMR